MKTKTLVCYALSCTSGISIALMVLALFLYEEDFIKKVTDEDYYVHSLAKLENCVTLFYSFESNPKDLDQNWERLEEVIRENETIATHIHTKKIECTVFQSACTKFGIDKYPAVVWMSQGNIVEQFEGDYTSYKSLKAFFDRMSENQTFTSTVATSELPSTIIDTLTTQKDEKHVHFETTDDETSKSQGKVDNEDPMYFHPSKLPSNRTEVPPSILVRPKIAKISEERHNPKPSSESADSSDENVSSSKEKKKISNKKAKSDDKQEKSDEKVSSSESDETIKHSKAHVKSSSSSEELPAKKQSSSSSSSEEDEPPAKKPRIEKSKEQNEDKTEVTPKIVADQHPVATSNEDSEYEEEESESEEEMGDGSLETFDIAKLFESEEFSDEEDNEESDEESEEESVEIKKKEATEESKKEDVEKADTKKAESQDEDTEAKKIEKAPISEPKENAKKVTSAKQSVERTGETTLVAVPVEVKKEATPAPIEIKKEVTEKPVTAAPIIEVKKEETEIPTATPIQAKPLKVAKNSKDSSKSSQRKVEVKIVEAKTEKSSSSESSSS